MKKIAVWLLILVSVILAALPNRSSAGDNLEISPADYKKAETMMTHWLSLADQGKYAESYAAASELFRKNSSVEQWTAERRKVLEERGKVVSRGKIEGFTPSEPPNSNTLPSYYMVTFKTKFEKNAGVEVVQLVRENGEWKVGHYQAADK
jgi:hypothetical protein